MLPSFDYVLLIHYYIAMIIICRCFMLLILSRLCRLLLLLSFASLIEALLL